MTPFDFRLNAVNAVHWPPAATVPKPTGRYCFELVGGDLLFGELVGLEAELAVLDVPWSGRLHVRRSQVRRIDRWGDGANLVYLGPNGLSSWHAFTADVEKLPEKMRAASGARRCRATSAARLCGAREARGAGRCLCRLQCPPFWCPRRPNFRARRPVSLRPIRTGRHFARTLASPFVRSSSSKSRGGPSPTSLSHWASVRMRTRRSHAYRFEVWDEDLVFYRETASHADMAPLAKVASGPGRLHVRVFLDQETGRALVVAPDGKPMTDLTVVERKPQVQTGVQVTNLRGDLCLERLRISRWDGIPPREVSAVASSLRRLDGSVLSGELIGLDAATREFVFRTEAGESRIAENTVAAVTLPASKDEPPGTVRAVCQDGVRLSGELTKVEDGSLGLVSPAIEEPLRLPIQGLRSLVVLRHSDEAKHASGRPKGRLELTGLSLTGHLEDGSEQLGASCLTWHPFGSDTASPLRPGLSKAVYRTPPPPRPKPRRPPQGAKIIVNGIVRRVMPGASTATPANTSVAAPALHLRTGDIIPCEVWKIDDKGITIKTELSDRSFVPHEKIKAVELAPGRCLKSARPRARTVPDLAPDAAREPAHAPDRIKEW